MDLVNSSLLNTLAWCKRGWIIDCGNLTLEFNFYKVRIKYVNYLRRHGKFGFKDNIPTLQNQWCMVYMIGHLSQKNIYILHWLNMDNSNRIKIKWIALNLMGFKQQNLS